jgi:hypothetical protein
MYRRVDVLLEGRDDKRFFDAVIRPMLQKRYDDVRTWEYAGASIARRINYLRSVQAMGNADYLFLSDLDASPCITERKRRLVKSHKGMIEAGRTIIVMKEIESWYLAGIDDRVCRGLGVRVLRRTDEVTKEQFVGLMPRRFNSVVEFMTEILRRFRIETARGKNRSFGYLMDKLEAGSKKA